MAQGSLIEIIRQGGFAMYPLVFCSIIMLAVAMERLWYLRNAVTMIYSLNRDVIKQVRDKKWDDALREVQHRRHAVADVWLELLVNKAKHPDNLRSIGDRKRIEAIQQCKRNLWLLGTIGSMAPFIGLFGTVIGIIRSFHSMSVSGSGGFSVVAAGISEALIATAGGLVIAVIAVTFYNYFQVRLNSISVALKTSVDEFTEALAEGN